MQKEFFISGYDFKLIAKANKISSKMLAEKLGCSVSSVRNIHQKRYVSLEEKRVLFDSLNLKFHDLDSYNNYIKMIKEFLLPDYKTIQVSTHMINLIYLFYKQNNR